MFQEPFLGSQAWTDILDNQIPDDKNRSGSLNVGLLAVNPPDVATSPGSLIECSPHECVRFNNYLCCFYYFLWMSSCI
jgi:hypothetical protein